MISPKFLLKFSKKTWQNIQQIVKYKYDKTKVHENKTIKTGHEARSSGR